MKRFIGYHFFHGVRNISPVEAYSRTRRAMARFTDQSDPCCRGFVLDMRNDEGGPLESLTLDLCARFGPVSQTTKSLSVRNAPTYRLYRWTLNPEQFQQSFALLEHIHAEIPISRERARLQSAWNFAFTRPDTSTLLPDQETMPTIDVRLGPGSSLVLATGRKTTVNAWFLFPFETPSQEFESYALQFQEELIFKFLPNHWRLWKHTPVRGWWPKKFVPGWYVGA